MYYRYGYLLTISDDEGMLCKYDYLLTDEILFNNSAVYYDLSGVDLCAYDLFNEEEHKEFFDTIDDILSDNRLEQIFILSDLLCELKKFLEV